MAGGPPTANQRHGWVEYHKWSFTFPFGIQDYVHLGIMTLWLGTFAQALQTSQRCILWVWRCDGLHICTILVSTRLKLVVCDVEISSRMTWRRLPFLSFNLFSVLLKAVSNPPPPAQLLFDEVTSRRKSDLTINFTYLRNQVQFPSCTKFHIDSGSQTTGGRKLTSDIGQTNRIWPTRRFKSW